MDATWRIEVQGVGFRPFVHRLATGIGIRGTVRNAGGQVIITATGSAARVEDAFAQIPPDLATCDDCLRELFDPADRRYRYPFVDCTACGPRATIIEALPYDRVRTTMSGFPMCPACAAEYEDAGNRRFHAEPIACPSCGPTLRFRTATGDEALRAAASLIGAGGVVAIKGLGGFQLVCDAFNEDAVTRVREAKGRETKPLAVMVRDLMAADSLAVLTAADRDLLRGTAAPILLAPRRHGVLAANVCGGMAEFGVCLPYTPLHHLLLAELRRPLVVTSTSHAGSDHEVDGVLDHDRPVVYRCDDSVIRTFGSRATVIRGARGLAPGLLRLPVAAKVPLLAVGAQQKSTFTLASGEFAVLGPHVGDLADARTLTVFEDTLDRLSAAHGIQPALVAHDLHPGYLSTRFAHRWPRRTGVQHHHAHVAAVAAEHGLHEPFLGVAYDGLGLGDDGTFWGGELLLATYTGYERLGRFSQARMPGGEAAVRRPARMAYGYLLDDAPPGLLGEREEAAVRRMIDRGVNSPLASSAGRLFDAASALLGLCGDSGFEGEAAMRLEEAAAPFAGAEPLAWRLDQHDGLWVYDGVATLRDLLQAQAEGEPVGRIAAAFHSAVAAVTVLMCERAAERTGVRTVCLSGGVFQNRLLAVDVLARLASAGFDVHIGERVPVNDGGISFGQAAIAAARSSSA
ncbi:carbamoyltransferase HypF [Nonomuraea sp. NPDC050556]|uniref:carbamoyltransferase HypF n=1 Tax=Nonomuraea sp. NPDC050556 TaxID=3364369 RepID=UPI0037A105DE